jgi:hypothetical protein
MLLTMLASAALLLHFAIAVILVRKYLLTRDVGFVWLGGAVVVWPLVSNMLSAGERVLVGRISKHEWVPFYPFTMVERGKITLGSLIASLALIQQLIGICLLLAAVFYLSRTTKDSVSSTS